MGMSSLLDPSAAKEFLRRATALGFNSAAMAAAAAGGTPPSHKPSGGGGNGGGSDRGDRNLDHSAGSPHANDPSGLRRPRSVYNSSQVKLEYLALDTDQGDGWLSSWLIALVTISGGAT